MECRSCGTILQPGAVACPTCGTPDTSDFSPYDDVVPYIPYIPSSASSSQQSHSHPQPYTSQQFYKGTHPFPDHNIQQLPSAVPQLPPIQQQRGGLSGAMIALLVILTLLVVAGGGLIYFVLAIRPSQHQTQTPAAPLTISTPQTSTNAQNTPPITTTNPQDLYTQATSGTPVFIDPNGRKAIDGSCTFTGSVLHASASHTSSVCLAGSTSFDNFAYQVSATIIQGNGGGLIFRSIPGSQAYILLIDSRGIYVLGSSPGNGLGHGNVKILAGGTSSAINTGLNQPNLLAVIARGSTIYLYVNKQYLTSVSDSTSSVGAIGVVGANTKDGPVDVAFSEIQVWRL